MGNWGTPRTDVRGTGTVSPLKTEQIDVFPMRKSEKRGEGRLTGVLAATMSLKRSSDLEASENCCQT